MNRLPYSAFRTTIHREPSTLYSTPYPPAATNFIYCLSHIWYPCLTKLCSHIRPIYMWASPLALLHRLPLTSMETTPGMKDGNRTRTETHPPQNVCRKRFCPSPHTPDHPSSIRPSIPLGVRSRTLIPPHQLIPPPLRQRAASNVTLSQWSERRRGALRIPPSPHTNTTPRYRTSLRTILHPSRGEIALM